MPQPAPTTTASTVCVRSRVGFLDPVSTRQLRSLCPRRTRRYPFRSHLTLERTVSYSVGSVTVSELLLVGRSPPSWGFPPNPALSCDSTNRCRLLVAPPHNGYTQRINEPAYLVNRNLQERCGSCRLRSKPTGIYVDGNLGELGVSSVAQRSVALGTWICARLVA